DVPIEIDWTAARVGRFQPELVESLCREGGFRQLARRLESLAGKLGKPMLPLPITQPGDSELEEAPDATAQPAAPAPALTTATSPAWNATYKTIATRDDLDWLVGELSPQPRLGLDTAATH